MIAPWGTPVQLIPGGPTLDGQWIDIGLKLVMGWLLVGATGFARAMAIRACGDPTPVLTGQLTAAPHRHHSLFSTWLIPALFLHLFRGTFTWPNGVPIPHDPRRLSNTGRLLVALSSPLTSALLGLAALGMIAGLVPGIDLMLGDPAFAALQSLSFLGLVGGLLHLFPVPPYEGGEVVRFLLPGAFLKKAWDVVGRLFGLVLFVSFYLFLMVYFIPSLSWLSAAVRPQLEPILLPLFRWIVMVITGIASLSEQVYWLVREG